MKAIIAGFCAATIIAVIGAVALNNNFQKSAESFQTEGVRL